MSDLSTTSKHLKKSSETKKRGLEDLQKGSIARIHRSEIVADSINPRKITEANAKRLKDSIKKNGLVGHLIWNRTTGHIVGGHQRLDAVDSIMRTKDYEIDVVQVEMSLKEEVRLNVVLNNADAMGVFDFGKIQDLSREFSLDVSDDFGFSDEVIDIQFPEIAEEKQIEDNGGEIPEPKVASAEDISKMKDMKKKARESLKEEKAEFGNYDEDAKGILTVVFQCESDKREWLKSINLPEDKDIVHIEEIEMPLVNELKEALLRGEYEEESEASENT